MQQWSFESVPEISLPPYTVQYLSIKIFSFSKNLFSIYAWKIAHKDSGTQTQNLLT